MNQPCQTLWEDFSVFSNNWQYDFVSLHETKSFKHHQTTAQRIKENSKIKKNGLKFWYYPIWLRKKRIRGHLKSRKNLQCKNESLNDLSVFGTFPYWNNGYSW